MTWITYLGVFLFAVAYGCILYLPYRRRKDAAAARETPGRVAPPLSGVELREKLRLIGVDHPELKVDDVGELIEVTWNLEPAADHAIVHENARDPTFKLELQIIEGDAVNVRFAVGEITWEPETDEGSRLLPSIVWRWPLEPVSGPEAPDRHWSAADEGLHGHRNLRHLVELVRRVVLDAGYAWQPMLEISPGEGQTTNSTAVDAKAPGQVRVVQSTTAHRV